jgi:hypothetical protein
MGTRLGSGLGTRLGSGLGEPRLGLGPGRERLLGSLLGLGWRLAPWLGRRLGLAPWLGPLVMT